jgi:hypothetical protein
MKITRQQAQDIYSILSQLKLNEPKLDWAFRRNIKKLLPITEETNDLRYEIQLSLASVDEKGNTQTDEKGQLKFTPEKQIELSKKLREFLKQEVEFEPYQLLPEHTKLEAFKLIPNNALAILEDVIFIDND